MVELIKALRRIQDECIKQGYDCNTCPLKDPNNAGCYLIHYGPKSWDIKSENDIIRVFNGKSSKYSLDD